MSCKKTKQKNKKVFALRKSWISKKQRKTYDRYQNFIILRNSTSFSRNARVEKVFNKSLRKARDEADDFKFIYCSSIFRHTAFHLGQASLTSRITLGRVTPYSAPQIRVTTSV
jgi:hypothetical protein